MWQREKTNLYLKLLYVVLIFHSENFNLSRTYSNNARAEKWFITQSLYNVQFY